MISGAACFAGLALMAGCQASPTPTAPSSGGKSAALRNMEQVATAAHRCWFASKDATFSDYSFANELNSFSGRPRFLLVPRGDYGGRPLLVVQAEGAAGTVTSFGPLMDGPSAARISADIRRWSAGGTDCAGTA
ncbi:hypothetical protein [Mesorhizobium sp. CAU 1741]|uniref:hypothetical protein n=1 Tax=Mesorhizobium sp. CAU 1741 TaxID=3140366 RepID=UPI00325A71B6